MRARSFVVPVPTKRAKKDIVDSTTFNYEGGAIMADKFHGVILSYIERTNTTLIKKQ
jgi:hypothetical protein